MNTTPGTGNQLLQLVASQLRQTAHLHLEHGSANRARQDMRYPVPEKEVLYRREGQERVSSELFLFGNEQMHGQCTDALCRDGGGEMLKLPRYRAVCDS